MQPTVWPVPYACTQPYHPGSGSHGQLFRSCQASSAWHSLRAVNNYITSRGCSENITDGGAAAYSAICLPPDCAHGGCGGKVQNMEPWSMDPLCEPDPLTGSIKIWKGQGPWTLGGHVIKESVIITLLIISAVFTYFLSTLNISSFKNELNFIRKRISPICYVY